MDLGLSLTILALGFAGSIISGLLGVGGAAVIIPLLLYAPPLLGLGSLDIKDATAIAVTHVFFSTSSGALAHARNQQVDRGVAISTSVGTVLGALPGAQLGSWLGLRLSGGVLRLLYAMLITSIALGLWYDLLHS